ncbi:MAG: helix-turn-helix domain-containing protein [Bifidobacteriaceae bacterium]|jgi:transcriptional regulator with XRE-family HTH domain|nr:helix-turn-helix domain-containing protein [Bifidobacteriaceae bacterium]
MIATLEATRASTAELEKALGQAVRRARIAGGCSQAELATLASVSLTALGNLETGKGSTVTTLVRVCRALGRLDWLESLAPPITISPLAIAHRQPAERRRVARSRPRQP